MKSARGGRKTVKSDNVRVFCRFRPVNEMERKKTHNGPSVVQFEGHETVLIKPDGVNALKKKSSKKSSSKRPQTARGAGDDDYNDNRFTFDYVFGMRSTQADVFEQAAAPMAEKLLSGYNCTVFAYGQTGSGKTHTMMGYSQAGIERSGTHKSQENDSNDDPDREETSESEPDSMYTDDEDDEDESKGSGAGDPNPVEIRWKNADEMGIIPRLVQSVFDEIKKQDAGVEYTVTVSYIEIYLEKVRDLLAPENDNLPIRETREKGVYIDGVKEKVVTSWEEVSKQMEKGENNRVVGKTRMNAQSSRSHSCLMLQVDQRDQQTYSLTSSKLTLVDLAGSEKVRKTGAEGLTLLQAQHTNKSLSALGGVIRALTENSSHIPYRDSKLSRLLQDSLGGNSMTSLIICASPSQYNVEETFSTLRFGRTAKLIKNKPKLNVEKSVAEYKSLLSSSQKKQRTQAIALSALRDVVDEAGQKMKEAGITPPEVPDPADVDDKTLAETEGDQLVDKTLGRSFVVRFKEQAESLEGRVAEVTEAMQKLQDRILEREDELHVAKQELSQFRAAFSKSRLRQAQTEAEEMKSKVSGLERTVDELREDLKSSKQQISQLEGERQRLSQDTSGLQSKVADMESSIKDKTEQLVRMKDERDALEDRLREAVNRADVLKNELDEHRSSLDKVKGQKAQAEGQLQVQIKSMEKQLSQMEETLKEKTAKLQEASHKASQQEEEIEGLRRNLAQQAGALKNIEDSSKSTSTRVYDLEMEKSTLQEQLTEAKNKIAQMEQAAKKKDDEIETLRDEKATLAEKVANAPIGGAASSGSAGNITMSIEMKEELDDLHAQLEEALAENIRLDDDLIDTRADAYDQLMELEECEKNLAEERQLHEETRLQLRKFLKKAELWEYIEANIANDTRPFRAVDADSKATIELPVKPGRYGWMALSRDLERQVRQWLKMARKSERRRG